MVEGKIVVLMGSQRDSDFASRIESFLQEEGFDVPCEYVVASAHRRPRKLLDEIEKFEKKEERIVFITVAGLSDALSGVAAGSTKYPVIACPPDSEKYGYAKLFSSTVTPKGVAVAYVPKPENAALSAVKILGLFSKDLERNVAEYMLKQAGKVSS
jgi:5-(carboxyamino)imidazole ribonucleotide mutase